MQLSRAHVVVGLDKKGASIEALFSFNCGNAWLKSCRVHPLIFGDTRLTGYRAESLKMQIKDGIVAQLAPEA